MLANLYVRVLIFLLVTLTQVNGVELSAVASFKGSLKKGNEGSGCPSCRSLISNNDAFWADIEPASKDSVRLTHIDDYGPRLESTHSRKLMKERHLIMS